MFVVATRIVWSFIVVDAVEALVHRDVDAHILEDEELGLRTPERLVGNTGFGEVALGAVGDLSRAAVIGLPGLGIDGVAGDREGRVLGERVDDCRRGVRHQDEVGFLDGRIPLNG